MSLLGRADECALLDGLIDDIRRGESRSLVLRGEAGIGKTALLKYLVESASDLTALRVVGVESEMELAFAAVHQLCGPMLGRLERLPAPQRQALEIVFGLSAGPAPDRFLVGLAVLSLFSEVADQRALLCVVDDAQWLDQASALTLAFVARRLLAESVGIVFAARERGEALQHLPGLEVHGVRNGDARKLLSSAVRFRLDERVRDRIVAETRGNPLALLELPRGLTATELAGGFGVLGARGLTGRIEESFVRQLRALSDDARRLVLLAAAEPLGDPLLLWRGAERLGIALAAADEAEAHGLLAIGERVRFRHPLARSAVYRSATAPERQAAHLALAESTDRDVDPDRRAWHLAAAAAGPDEDVARELELSAGRAQGRGGLVTAAAFLQRAVALTGDPARRADRTLAAAQASLRAGAFDAARGLLAAAQAGPLDELGRARMDLLQAGVALPRTAAATRHRSCSRLPGSSRRSTYASRATRISMGGAQPWAWAGWRVPAAACSTSLAPWRLRRRPILRLRAICCSTASRWSSPKGAPPQRPCYGARSLRSPAPRSPPRRCSGGVGWRRGRRTTCGTTTAVSKSARARFNSPATPGRSRSSPSRIMCAVRLRR